MRLGSSFPSINFACGAALADAAEFSCADSEVLALDIQNTGSAALTGFSVVGRISPGAPFRDITPASFTSQSYQVLESATVTPVGLAAGAFSRFALNVSVLESVKVLAAGAAAALQINAAGYQE